MQGTCAPPITTSCFWEQERHMWHPLLVWSSPVHLSEMFICRGRPWRRYFTVLSSDCDRYSAARVSLVPLMLSVFVSVLLFCSSLFPGPSFSLTCSTAPCASSLPPEPQCNIHDGAESSQMCAGDTQKDLEKSFCYLCRRRENSNVYRLVEFQTFFDPPWHAFC